ncbi:MAG: thiamine diphosphokinase [Lachnospiraceae bacterium]|nr:thiamine diphosphokinase [Lachnospiraceae bacterium]
MGKEKRCFVMGAGSFTDMKIRPEKEDLVIAADGGYEYLKRLGIKPDLLLGDFDSLELIPEHDHLIRHSPIKDDTDMALAVAWGEEKGFQRFILYGGMGGRIDHTLANFQLLTALSRKGYAAYLIGEGYIVTAVTGGRLNFHSRMTGMISVFCMGERAEDVTLKGFKYCMDHGMLTCDRALGVSNEFTGQHSSVEVRQGTLLVMWNETEGLEESREKCR